MPAPMRTQKTMGVRRAPMMRLRWRRKRTSSRWARERAGRRRGRRVEVVGVGALILRGAGLYGKEGRRAIDATICRSKKMGTTETQRHRGTEAQRHRGTEKRGRDSAVGSFGNLAL